MKCEGVFNIINQCKPTFPNWLRLLLSVGQFRTLGSMDSL